jgi:ADP-heptose:LPS heptosyltransferase
MVRRMGQTIAERNRDIDEVIVYDEDGMYLDLKSGDSDRFLRAYETADSYARRIREGHYDVLYNCTQSFPSTILFTAAGLSNVVGAHLSEDWRYVIRGCGPNYFFTSILNREYNDLNLCDLFRYFVTNPPASEGLVFQVTDEDRARARAILHDHGILDDDFLVCFQLGASDKDKRWPAARFAALGRLLRERYKARIVLLGVSEEARFGDEFEQHAPGLAVPLFGKTSIPQLAAVLERARMLVTNDTGTMHIAAAVRCPIVLVSVGYVHFRETGPYGAGHIAIERRRAEVGRSDIRGTDTGEVTAEHVMQAIEVRLRHGQSRGVPTLGDTSSLDSVDLYWSDFAPDGCLQWYPLVRRRLSETDLLRMAYRAMWLAFLGSPVSGSGSREECGEDVEGEGMRRVLACFEKPPCDELQRRTAEYHNALDALLALAQRGIEVSDQLARSLKQDKNLRRAKELVNRLMALDEDIRLQGELHGACRPLVGIARFERDNLEGADPMLLTQTTRGIYRDMHARSLLLREKIARVDKLCISRQRL